MILIKPNLIKWEKILILIMHDNAQWKQITRGNCLVYKNYVLNYLSNSGKMSVI